MVRTNVILAVVCLSVLIGLCRDRLAGHQIYLAVAGLLSIFAAIRLRSVLVPIAFILGIALGNFRTSVIWPELQQYSGYIGQKVQIEGTVISDPIYGYKRQVDFYVGEIQFHEKSGSVQLPGKIRVSGFGSIDISRGDRTKVEGKLRNGYGSYQGSIGFATYEVIAKSASPVQHFRKHFVTASQTVLPEPQVSLGLGFIAGIRDYLPSDLKDDLSATGLTHIVAVSGYNTTILALAARKYFGRFSRYQALAGTVAVLLLFLSITGIAASVVRASIVTIMSTVAWFYGRQFAPMVLLLGSAALSAMISPLSFWYDLGWWLSFLAFFGIIVLVPLIKKRFFKKKLGLIKNIMLETSCAQLMTLPLILWVFHRFSVVAIVANMIVLPLVPLAMLLTFLAGLMGMLSPILVGIFVWPARALLSYILQITNSLADIPGAARPLLINKVSMVVIYAVIALATWFLSWRASQLRPISDN